MTGDSRHFAQPESVAIHGGARVRRNDDLWSAAFCDRRGVATYRCEASRLSSAFVTAAELVAMSVDVAAMFGAVDVVVLASVWRSSGKLALKFW